MSEILVILEHDGQHLKVSSLNAISLAKQLGEAYDVLVLGSEVNNFAGHWGLQPKIGSMR